MNGLLNLHKPPGPTSHDVVARVRRLLGVRRVGHAGTLDPMAEGVLLVAVGPATRLVEYLHDLPKEYRAALEFGRVTDTQDATGTTLAEQDASGLTREQVEAALAPFRGRIEQLPPMYSAVKLAGRPLYERARRGETVERAPRAVEIHALALEAFTPGPRATAALRIACSSGTYVRTLCHDLGAVLGPGAVMTALVRTAIGPFTLAQAAALEGLARAVEQGAALPCISPADAVAHLPSVSVDAEQAGALRQGRRLAVANHHAARAPIHPLREYPVPARVPTNWAAAATVRVLDGAGRLVAIARCTAGDDGARLAPEKVFPESE